MKLTFQNKIVIITLVIVFFLLCRAPNFITIEGLDNTVTLYNENTPRWMRLIKDRQSFRGIQPDRGYTGIDFSKYLLDETPLRCPDADKPPGCPSLLEPHLGRIPRGYPDIFADHRDGGAADPAPIIHHALDPDNLLRDGVNPFTESDLERLLVSFEGQKQVQRCGSPVDGVTTRGRRRGWTQQMNTYKCDYNEDGRLTYIQEE